MSILTSSTESYMSFRGSTSQTPVIDLFVLFDFTPISAACWECHCTNFLSAKKILSMHRLLEGVKRSIFVSHYVAIVKKRITIITRKRLGEFVPINITVILLLSETLAAYSVLKYFHSLGTMERRISSTADQCWRDVPLYAFLVIASLIEIWTSYTCFAICVMILTCEEILTNLSVTLKLRVVMSRCLSLVRKSERKRVRVGLLLPSRKGYALMRLPWYFVQCVDLVISFVRFSDGL